MTDTKGLLPSCWGSPLWHALHSIAMAYVPSPENKKKYFDFFASLGNVLPCEECKKHYKENFQKTSGDLQRALETNDGLFRWVYDLHNLVNRQTGVSKEKWPSYQEIVKKYENFKVSCGNTPGVCGAVPGKVPEKRVRIVEEFGTFGSVGPETIGLIVISILLVGSLIYIAWNRKKKRKRSVR